jgi:hypothetical protein
VGPKPVHVSSTSHGPAAARQVAPADSQMSEGHVASTPSHVSAGSHAPADARQIVPAGRSVSAGQDVDRPVQVSARSHAPPEGRHTCIDPTVTIAHVPFVGAPDATLHAWQSLSTPPPQLVLQQTPSTQLPDVHAPLPVHAAPFASFSEQ